MSDMIFVSIRHLNVYILYIFEELIRTARQNLSFVSGSLPTRTLGGHRRPGIYDLWHLLPWAAGLVHGRSPGRRDAVPPGDDPAPAVRAGDEDHHRQHRHGTGSDPDQHQLRGIRRLFPVHHQRGRDLRTVQRIRGASSAVRHSRLTATHCEILVREALTGVEPTTKTSGSFSFSAIT